MKKSLLMILVSCSVYSTYSSEFSSEKPTSVKRYLKYCGVSGTSLLKVPVGAYYMAHAALFCHSVFVHPTKSSRFMHHFISSVLSLAAFKAIAELEKDLAKGLDKDFTETCSILGTAGGCAILLTPFVKPYLFEKMLPLFVPLQ